jgi:hypothetical protein
MQQLPLDSTDQRIQFLLYYAFCEKLAAGMIGATIDPMYEVESAYKNSGKLIGKTSVEKACAKIEFVYPIEDIGLIFDKGNDEYRTARHLRNQFIHKPGPTHLLNIQENSPLLLPKMRHFLEGIGKLSQYAQKLGI